MINQKRGQFYLIATIIIIAMIAGFVVVSNYAKKREVIKLYYIKQELEIESENVLDYGISKGENLDSVLEDFIRDYVDYAGERKNLYFIFGDTDNKIFFVGYQESTPEEVLVNDQSVIVDGNTHEISNPGNEVIIVIGDNEYIFTLKEGENFYFVISQEIEGEKYVITS